MLEFMDIGIKGVVAYRLEGKITTAEMNAVLDRFRQIHPGFSEFVVSIICTSISR